MVVALVASAGTLLAPAAGSQSGANLVKNPGAEDSPGGACDDNTGFSPPVGWQVTGRLTALKNDCPPATGGVAGNQMFAGGPNRGVSTGSQVVDLAAYASAIDGSATQATLSGLLGGWQDQGDYATVEVTFLDQAGRSLGSLKIGPVTAADRGNKTVLLPRSTTGAVPSGSRKARIVLTAAYVAGAVYNDGYADDISLTLRPGPASTAAPSWSGCWARPSSETGGFPNSVLVLSQSGTTVTGSFNWSGGGRVSGTGSGNTLTGTWRHTSNPDQGTFQLTIAADGKSFSGTYNGAYRWSGTRVSCGKPVAKPLTASKEYRAFLGLDNAPTSNWSARTDDRLEDLERRASTFRDVSDESPVPGERDFGKHSTNLLYPNGDFFRLLALDLTSAQLVKEGNVYARITRRSQEVLRASILASEGNLQPADVIYYALRATGGSYPLAVLAAHNLLKDVAKIGRQAIDEARSLRPGTSAQAIEAYNSRQEQELATLRRQVAVVQKLANLRASPARSGDKMGPWYHGFAVLTAGAFVGPPTAQAVVFAEHNAKWSKTALQKLGKLLPASWLPKEGFFKGEGGYDPEKHALDKAFADAAGSLALRKLSRHSL